MDDTCREWTPDGLRQEIAELESLLQRTNQYEDDLDVQWTRRLCLEVLARRRELLVALETRC